MNEGSIHLAISTDEEIEDIEDMLLDEVAKLLLSLGVEVETSYVEY